MKVFLMKVFLGLLMIIFGAIFPLFWVNNELYHYIPAFLSALLSVSLIMAGVYILAKEVFK